MNNITNIKLQKYLNLITFISSININLRVKKIFKQLNSSILIVQFYHLSELINYIFKLKI